MHIAELKPSERAVVAALAHVIWPVAYASILTPAQIDNLLLRIYSDENLRTEMAAGHRFWVAYDGGPAGFASAYRDADVVWLKKLYVLPARQGTGIGRALIDAAITAFAPVRDLRLYVNDHNIAAQRFYERSGFTCIGEEAVRMGDYGFTDKIYRHLFT
jgi:diamine N-acetyltransferase